MGKITGSMTICFLVRDQSEMDQMLARFEWGRLRFYKNWFITVIEDTSTSGEYDESGLDDIMDSSMDSLPSDIKSYELVSQSKM